MGFINAPFALPFSPALAMSLSFGYRMTPSPTRLGDQCTLLLRMGKSHSVEFVKFCLGEFQGCSSNVLFHVLYRRGTRDWQHHRRTLQKPRESHLQWARLMRRGDPAENLSSKLSRAQREPRNKADSLPLAVVKNVLP